MSQSEDEILSLGKGCGCVIASILIPICSLIAWVAWLVTK